MGKYENITNFFILSLTRLQYINFKIKFGWVKLANLLYEYINCIITKLKFKISSFHEK